MFFLKFDKNLVILMVLGYFFFLAPSVPELSQRAEKIWWSFKDSYFFTNSCNLKDCHDSGVKTIEDFNYLIELWKAEIITSYYLMYGVICTIICCFLFIMFFDKNKEWEISRMIQFFFSDDFCLFCTLVIFSCIPYMYIQLNFYPFFYSNLLDVFSFNTITSIHYDSTLRQLTFILSAQYYCFVFVILFFMLYCILGHSCYKSFRQMRDQVILELEYWASIHFISNPLLLLHSV